MTNILTTIPKKRKRRVTARFVGTYLPTTQADYLTLYCNAFKVPKIKVFKTLIERWMTKTMEIHSTDELESIIANECVTAWELSSVSKTIFLTTIRKELRKKKLEQDVVERIIILIENGGKKTNT